LPKISLQDINAIATELKANNNFTTFITGSESNDIKLPSNEELVALVTNTAAKKILKHTKKKLFLLPYLQEL
jgi:hypothetical protein